MKVLRLALVVIGFAATASFASAGTIVLGDTKLLANPVAATQTSVEFYLDRTAAEDGTALSVGNYQVRVALSGTGAGSTVRILGVSPTTTRLQAFALDTTNVTAGTSAYAATLNFASPFNIADGAGLMKIDLEVQPGASGNYTLSVLSGAGNTEFTSPIDFAALLPVDAGSGTLNVVPEPSSLPLGIVMTIGAGLKVSRRKRAA